MTSLGTLIWIPSGTTRLVIRGRKGHTEQTVKGQKAVGHSYFFEGVPMFQVLEGAGYFCVKAADVTIY